MAERKKITREQSLTAKPVAVKIERREELPDGGQRVFVNVPTSRSQRLFLRVGETVERQFELDTFGIEILDMCDGQKTVQYIIRQMAKRHNVDVTELEAAVLAFVKTLTTRGLIRLLIKKA